LLNLPVNCLEEVEELGCCLEALDGEGDRIPVSTLIDIKFG
jgi:hypothetical protein